MKTKMQEKVEEELRQEKMKKESEFKLRRMQRVLAYVPELQEFPFVKIPLKCKLGFHNFYWFKNKDGPKKIAGVTNYSNVEICVRCGKVFSRWWVGDPIINPFKSETYFAGYGNPNKDLLEEKGN